MTVAHRNDIQRAMSEAVEAASRGAGARGQLTQQSLPPIRLQVVKVASEVRRPFLCLNWRWLVAPAAAEVEVGRVGGHRARQATDSPSLLKSGTCARRGWAMRGSRARTPPPAAGAAPRSTDIQPAYGCARSPPPCQAEVPKIPEDEMLYVQQMLSQLQKNQAAQKAQAAAGEPEEQQPPVRPAGRLVRRGCLEGLCVEAARQPLLPACPVLGSEPAHGLPGHTRLTALASPPSATRCFSTRLGWLR